MRDLSFFLFKNSLASKMKKGFRNSCNGDASTSTLNQQHNPPTTLEEMILHLEFEEEMAKRDKKQQLNNNVEQHGRMSCVNNSDILRSARNALNQYPRFSLDGRDAMYRSSFRNLDGFKAGRRSVCCDHGLEERLLYQTGYKNMGGGGGGGGGGSSKIEKNRMCLPAILGGESVVWCKPGVVAKLMGLEAMPVPLMKRQNLRRRADRRLAMDRKGNVRDTKLSRQQGSAFGGTPVSRRNWKTS
ncbi:hypothetical protein ACOSQ2_017918 [Xanthoceras sorbifolium]